MTTTTFPNQKETVNNCHQQSDVDVRTVQKVNSTFAYPQNEELFSIDVDLRQKEGTFLQQLHCNDFDDIAVRIKANPRIVTIPVDLLEKLAADSSLKGHLDSSGEMGHNGI
ncbi:MAG: hypothetical protein EGQ00_02375 [Parabacteroides johnsonii]|jgi:hypothetical protein|nr:hypothetical protein [Parabacteroides johnsonii]